MPQENLGYVKLEWSCPKCGSRNPGPQKTCLGCGAPQPENVQFEQVEGQELVKEEAEIKHAKAAPDIHCAFCGTRNPAGSTVCSQCGADLKQGQRREVGRVVGAFQTGPVRQVACPSCGTLNLETALKCAGCGATLKAQLAASPAAPANVASNRSGRPWLIYALAGGFLVLCLAGLVAYALLTAPRESQHGVVEAASWQTSVAIEALQPVTHEDWQDQVPAGAKLGSCQDEVRTTSDQEPSGGNYNKVCGTAYTKDTGTGYGEVVQDCHYEILAPYCQYTVREWQRVDEASLSGNDFSPVWPEPQLSQDQRLGEQQAMYTVVFETDKGQYTYALDDLDQFKQYKVDSEWILNINALNQIVSVEPVQ